MVKKAAYSSSSPYRDEHVSSSCWVACKDLRVGVKSRPKHIALNFFFFFFFDKGVLKW
jgi:hypothetical protein